MAHNPELDHEFREGKKPVQPQHNPLLYGDISAGLQPRAGVQARMDPEMMAALKESNRGSKKQQFIYAAAAIGVMLAVALVWYILSVTGILPNY